MLFKLSIKNIRKSIKDYSIYFFTLVFAVSMFYMFNSIDAQSSMLMLNNSKYEIIKTVILLISYVSVFVSVVLGFLIVYSNNFLIRRRKKEIGLYFTLGMSKRKVSMIIVLETFIIGIISLIVGLVLGVLLSQFLSIFAAKLFEVDMSNFKFVFSSLAFTKTILYFTIIFILVMVFNIITLSRYKLIDLINAGRKNEKIKIRNKYLTIATFLLSVVFIGYAYYLLFHDALVMMDYQMIIMLVSGSIGTFLLFYSLSGFLLKVIARMKNIYYKGLNIFTLKQVNNKINTTVFSTSIICLMLLLTIAILSGSISLGKVFNNDLTENNLSDYTIRAYPNQVYINEGLQAEVREIDILKNFEELENSGKLKDYTTDYVLVHKYTDPKLFSNDMMTNEAINKLKKEYGEMLSLDIPVTIISESEYKKLMQLFNKKTINIESNEYLLLANIDFIINAYKDYYTSKSGITINDKKLYPASDKIVKTAIENANTAGNEGILVIDDSIMKNLILEGISLIGNFNKNNNPEELAKDLEIKVLDNLPYAVDMRTKISMEASSVGIKAMMIYIGLYLGITFAITSATILAIGQLSESSDNKSRYKILRQIGADERMINKALFRQIVVVFAFPLIVALVHSYFGLKELNSLIIAIGNIDLTSNIILTTLFMIIVYGGYFTVTYLCSKSIIKND